MKRTRLKKKLNTLRRSRYHWCQLSDKFKSIGVSQKTLLQHN